MKWISVEDRLPEGKCLVFLEDEMAHLHVHSATYHENVTVIGSRFDFDCPKVTHWMPIPEAPSKIAEPELDYPGDPDLAISCEPDYDHNDGPQ